jgi:hypothetical protein
MINKNKRVFSMMFELLHDPNGDFIVRLTLDGFAKVVKRLKEETEIKSQPGYRIGCLYPLNDISSGLFPYEFFIYKTFNERVTKYGIEIKYVGDCPRTNVFITKVKCNEQILNTFLDLSRQYNFEMYIPEDLLTFSICFLRLHFPCAFNLSWYNPEFTTYISLKRDSHFHLFKHCKMNNYSICFIHDDLNSEYLRINIKLLQCFRRVRHYIRLYITFHPQKTNSNDNDSNNDETDYDYDYDYYHSHDDHDDEDEEDEKEVPFYEINLFFDSELFGTDHELKWYFGNDEYRMRPSDRLEVTMIDFTDKNILCHLWNDKNSLIYWLPFEVFESIFNHIALSNMQIQFPFACV